MVALTCVRLCKANAQITHRSITYRLSIYLIYWHMYDKNIKIEDVRIDHKKRFSSQHCYVVVALCKFNGLIY